jgi:cation transport protein ChaC
MTDVAYQPAAAPAGDPDLDSHETWVFGYGSLMWRPGFPFADVMPATLTGFHRDLCLISIHYRGTRERPGLVCGLCPGGSCTGRAFRLEPETRLTALKYLDDRELITKIYIPRRLPIELADGRRVTARVYVSDATHVQFVGDWSDERKVAHIVQGVGSEGRSFDYLANIARHLDALGIADATIARLHGLARAAINGRGLST